jgi:hypothetical protein
MDLETETVASARTVERHGTPFLRALRLTPNLPAQVPHLPRPRRQRLQPLLLPIQAQHLPLLL